MLILEMCLRSSGSNGRMQMRSEQDKLVSTKIIDLTILTLTFRTTAAFPSSSVCESTVFFCNIHAEAIAYCIL